MTISHPGPQQPGPGQQVTARDISGVPVPLRELLGLLTELAERPPMPADSNWDRRRDVEDSRHSTLSVILGSLNSSLRVHDELPPAQHRIAKESLARGLPALDRDGPRAAGQAARLRAEAGTRRGRQEVTADQRLASAREYLSHARGVQIGQVPHPALQRMAAELRRQLGQVLNATDEASEALASALADAIRHRDPGLSCAECEQNPADLCDDCAADLDLTDAYLQLADELGLEIPQ